MDNLQVINVSHAEEWAEVYLKPLFRESYNGESYNGVMLTLQSSFGSFGHHWGNIGKSTPAAFLAKITDDYVVSKLFLGNTRTTFNQELLVSTLQAKLEVRGLYCARAGIDISAAQAELDDWACGDFSSFERAYEEFSESDCSTLRAALGESEFEFSDLHWGCHSVSPTVTGFMERIWAPFRAKMLETALAEAPAAVPA